MLMLDSEMMEGQLLAGFLETLRGLPEAQAELSGVLQPGTRARSLRSYVERYEPRRAIKLIGGSGGEREGRIETWPLYYAQHLRDL